MTLELKHYQSAKLIITQYGDDALLHAANRADELLQEGDMAGQRNWLHILEAISELQNLEPGSVVH